MYPRRPLMQTRPRAPKPARRLLPLTRLYLVVCLTAASAVAGAAAEAAEPDILGSWRLDDAATAEVQPVDGARGGGLEGFRAPTISINGIPLPGAGSNEPSTAGSAPDPDVLRCSRLIIEPLGDRIRLTYTGVGAETLEPGRHQGITTRWKGNLLTSSYATTSRRVTQRFELQGDDSLLVTVKLDPRRGQAVTYKRMFQREGAAPTEPAPASAPAPAPAVNPG